MPRNTYTEVTLAIMDNRYIKNKRRTIHVVTSRSRGFSELDTKSTFKAKNRALGHS